MSGGTLLSILKVISEGLTAGFGILGLVTEFKDEKTKRITRNGKVALGGIIISFIVSGAITTVENANSRAAEKAHAVEIRRLSRPLGILRVQVDYSLKSEPKDATSVNLEQIAEWAVKHQTRDLVFDGDFPASLQAKLPSRGLISSGITIEIYAKAFSCPKVASLDRDPDLLLKTNTQRSTRGWQYFAEPRSNYLYVTNAFDMTVIKDRGLIASVEDLPESTVMVWSSAFDDPHVQFQSVDLNVGSGGSKFRLTGGKENEIKSAGDQRGYCYTKPNVWPPLNPDHPTQKSN
jgi:hypothetical protein